MSNTPNLEMPLLALGQAQKETTHNQAVVILDAIHGGVVSRTETTPPAATGSGVAYIVPAGASGVWSGHTDEIAYDFGSVWNFIEPTAAKGLPLYVDDDEEYVKWNGAAYIVVAFAGAVSADSVPYTPADPGDWGSPTPDDVAQALDELAASGGGGALDDLSDVDAPSPSDGDVLTYDSGTSEWVAAAPTGGGGALVLLESHTASASSTLDFTTRNAAGQSGATIQSDYDSYMIEGVDIIAGTNGESLRMRVGTGGGPTFDTGSNYQWTRNYNVPGGTYSWAGSASNGSDTAMTLMVIVSSTGPTDFTMKSRSPRNAYQKFFTWEGKQQASDGAFYDNNPASGRYTQTTALTAFRFFLSAGTFSGTIRVYGIAK